MREPAGTTEELEAGDSERERALSADALASHERILEAAATLAGDR